MPIGLQNLSAPTMENITQVGNFTQPIEFMVNANWIIYAGWLYFVLLLTLWVILFMSKQDAQQGRKYPVNNLMVSGAVVSVLALIHRLISISIDGVLKGLLTDYQMWLFPVITSLLAAFLWATKDR